MQKLWISLAIWLISVSLSAADSEQFQLNDTISMGQFQSQLAQLDQHITNKTNEKELKQTLRNLNRLSSQLADCVKKESSTSKTDNENSEDRKLAINNCTSLYESVNTLKNKTLSRLNQFSFYRLKTQQTSLFSASVSNSSLQTLKFSDYISLLLHLLAGSLLFILFWFILKQVYRRSGNTEKAIESTSKVMVLLSLISFIVIWFSNIGTRLYQTEIWYSLLMVSCLFFCLRQRFDWKSGLQSLIVFVVSVFSADILFKELAAVSFLLLLLDSFVLMSWLLALFLLFHKPAIKHRIFLMVFSGLVILLDLAGFHYATHQLVLTAITLRLLWIVVQLIVQITPMICRYYYFLLSQIPFFKNEASLTSHLPGFFWIHWGTVLGLSLILLNSQLSIMGVPDYYTEQWQMAVTDGFNLGTISISISSILQAMIVFGMLISIAKLIKNKLGQERQPVGVTANYGKEAIAAIFWYSSVVTAALVSLSIAGFSVQNLALVAGAFSVGIGFGLQNIVSNFVSGLILLIERPIKRGDWIVTGNTEGIVQNVNIRATQIQTFDRADIIIPNSDLITTQVTNWMLNDRIGRLRLKVGVAYGSDTEKVKSILTSLANEHPKTISDNDDYPCQVLFVAFGDSSLNFEVRVFLHNISDLPLVQSELNYQIDQAFRKNNIEIPFPQRDLHIRSDHTNRGSLKGD